MLNVVLVANMLRAGDASVTLSNAERREIIELFAPSNHQAPTVKIPRWQVTVKEQDGKKRGGNKKRKLQDSSLKQETKHEPDIKSEVDLQNPIPALLSILPPPHLSLLSEIRPANIMANYITKSNCTGNGAGKRVRRKASEIVRTHLCTHPGCHKWYGSQDSLRLHDRLKHSGGVQKGSRKTIGVAS
jgi:hypothetical protein